MNLALKNIERYLYEKKKSIWVNSNTCEYFSKDSSIVRMWAKRERIEHRCCICKKQKWNVDLDQLLESHTTKIQHSKLLNKCQCLFTCTLIFFFLWLLCLVCSVFLSFYSYLTYLLIFINLLLLFITISTMSSKLFTPNVSLSRN